MHSPLPCCTVLFVLMGAGLLAAAHAAPPAAPHTVLVPIPARAPAHSAAPVSSPAPGLGPSVGNAELARLNGGTSTYDTITLNGTVSNTTTTDAVTGLNEIGGGAFANAVGFPMVIQNSGNSVLIQNATIINVQMQP
ncbi:MAG: hypothetical protein OJF61_002036 [Rhodanobacteraceae bacterium]|nr:MAG: hypothetical protein OJF61_002036 [Rhodanobacteraceae bacterium]